jgi:hypothetical protein
MVQALELFTPSIRCDAPITSIMSVDCMTGERNALIRKLCRIAYHNAWGEEGILEEKNIGAGNGI